MADTCNILFFFHKFSTAFQGVHNSLDFCQRNIEPAQKSSFKGIPRCRIPILTFSNILSFNFQRHPQLHKSQTRDGVTFQNFVKVVNGLNSLLL